MTIIKRETEAMGHIHVCDAYAAPCDDPEDQMVVAGFCRFILRYFVSTWTCCLLACRTSAQSQVEIDMHLTGLHLHTFKVCVKLKSVLCSSPVLQFYDVNTPTDLYVDASGQSIGSVLQQIKDGCSNYWS